MEHFVNNVFGYCYYEINGESALIYGLYVYPQCRRKGASKVLLRHVISEIRWLGYSGAIDVEVLPREDSITAEELAAYYVRMGLRVI